MTDTVQVVAEDNDVKTLPKKCHAAILLDRSGSMASMLNEPVDAYNAQLETLRKESHDIPTNVSLFTFSNVADEPIVWDQSIENINNLNHNEYTPDGMTSMLDSVGMAIDKLINLPDANDPDTVFIMSIISDGMENNSKKENFKSIAEKIQACKSTKRWTFSYLGCNQDLSDLSAKMGLSKGDTRSFVGTSLGMKTGSADTSQLYAGVYSAFRTGTKSVNASYSSVIGDDPVDNDPDGGK